MSSQSSKAKRRYLPAAEKVRILAAYDTAASPIERAEIMRREGVYASLISKWRRQIDCSTKPKRGRPLDENRAEVDRLNREISRLKARAERAEDMVETLGKVHALLQNAVSKSATEIQRSNTHS